MLPILWKTSNYILYSYPLFMGVALGFAYNFSKFLLERETSSSKGLNGIFWGAFIFSWIGAKLFFLMFSAGDNLAQYAQASNFWLGGGFVFYGGFVFGALYCITYSLFFKKFPWSKIHLLLPALALAHGIGRIGCFFAGCCYGIETDLFSGIHLHRHPVQLYEAVLLFLLTSLLLKMIKRYSVEAILTTYLCGYAIIRFGLEFLRGDLIRGIYMWGLSTSQLISLILFVSVLSIVLIRMKLITRNLLKGDKL